MEIAIPIIVIAAVVALLVGRRRKPGCPRCE